MSRLTLHFLVAAMTCAVIPTRAQLVLTNCTESALRSALTNGSVIRFDCDATLLLTNTLLIATNTTLDGTGRAVTFNGGNQVRLFEVLTNVTLTLRNVRLTSGLHGGNSTNTNTVVTASGTTARGGAIHNRGTVVLVNSHLSGNTAEGVHGRVGESPATSSGQNGEDGGHGQGGAIFNDRGLLIITNSVFFANRALGGDGGDGGNGGAFGNGTHGGDGGHGGFGAGGAIFNHGGVVQIFDSSFASNNVAGAVGGFGGFPSGLLGFDGANGRPGSARGGAIFNDGGLVTIHNSAFAVNTGTGATGNDGLPGRLSGDGEDGEDGSAALGGGIFQQGGTLKIADSTFADAILIGGTAGKGGDGGADGFGGDGGDGGHGGRAAGGGLYLADGTAELSDVTISGTVLIGGEPGAAGEGGGLTGRPGDSGAAGRTSGPEIEKESGTVEIKTSEATGSAVPPTLAARLGPAGELTLAWPAVGNFVLETTGSLVQPIRWNVVTAPVVAIDGENSVSLGRTGQIAFFRLRSR